MSAPRITLQSVTGVDVELTIAGPGSRSYAFVIDWHIRLILALAVFLVANFLYGGSFLADTISYESYVLWVILPTAVVYLLYHPVLEVVMRGRTPGKRIAGVRLVTREGDIPGIGALLLRNAFRVLDSLPGVYLVGLVTVIFTQHHVRVGDLAAGTLLILDHDGGTAAFAVSSTPAGLSAQSADLIHELLDRWTALDERSRADIARSLLARVDPTLTAAELSQLDAAALQQRLAAKLHAS